MPSFHPGQVVMTIIVAFILEAFVFRMNYSRKNQDSEGLCGASHLGHLLPSVWCPAVHPTVSFLAAWLSSHWWSSLSIWLVCLNLFFALIVKY
jgi:hypothetical protein